MPPTSLWSGSMAEVLERHNVHLAGSGRTTVVLGHGFGGDQTVWRDILPWLTPRFRVVLYDLAGSGAVAPEHYDPIRYGTLDAHAEDLLAILRALSIERCVFIGHSLSGMVGLLAGLERSELFERMIMIGASPCYLNQEGYQGGFDRAELDHLFEMLATHYQTWAVTFAPIVVDGLPGQPAVEEFARGLLSMRPDIALSMALTIFNVDLRDRLDDFTVPTVLVQTRHDAAVPMPVAEYLNRHLRGSVLEVIDASGHLPHRTAPQEIIRVLAKHLGDLAES